MSEREPGTGGTVDRSAGAGLGLDGAAGVEPGRPNAEQSMPVEYDRVNSQRRSSTTGSTGYGRGEWGRRRWVEVLGLGGRAPRVALRDARAAIFCGCGRLVVLGEWNAVEWCECGVCYRLDCRVKMEVFDE